ncbi:MAG: DUF1559 domain-containing protein [Planctomycetaceae bacterium]
MSQKLSRCSFRRRLQGFTLIELLVVMAIIGVLVALLLPAVQSARAAARKTSCMNNLKQIGAALHNYHDMHQSFPPGYVYRLGPTGNEAGFGWATMLLPLVEQTNVYHEFNFNVPLWDNANIVARTTPMAVFHCPADPVDSNEFIEMGVAPVERYAIASFVACFGPPDLDANQEQRDGMFSRNSSTRVQDVADGLSQTLAAGERANGPFRAGIPHGVHFTYETTWSGAVRQFDDPTDDHGHMILFQTGHAPNALDSDDRDVSAPHDGFAQFLLADGGVHTISALIDFPLYQALGTMDGNETIPGF